MAERIDLYDREGNRLGRTVERKKNLAADLTEEEYILVVHLAIFNKKGELLIQQRSREKKGWAGLWDFSAGGHVSAGESSLDAVVREAREELGFEPEGEWSFLSREIIPHVLDDFYQITAEPDLGTLTLQREEVSQVRWASTEEILSLLREERFVPYEEEMIRRICR